MPALKLGEQIASFRKKKGLTQEELAQALGVSNQAVSKWESGQCCPDIALLPDIAKLFGVSIDQLMGCRPTENIESLYTDIYMDIKALFAETPEKDCFRLAFRLAALLHEAACSKGYKVRLPWDAERTRGLGAEALNWDFSACSEPEGTTVMAEAGVFLADRTEYKAPTASQLRGLSQSLEKWADLDILKTLFSIYNLTSENEGQYASLAEIASQARLPAEAVEKALEIIPVEEKIPDSGETLYRIEGCCMHIPPLLLMLREK